MRYLFKLRFIKDF